MIRSSLSCFGILQFYNPIQAYLFWKIAGQLPNKINKTAATLLNKMPVFCLVST